MIQIDNEFAAINRRMMEISAGPRILDCGFGSQVEESLRAQNFASAVSRPRSGLLRSTIDSIVSRNAALWRIDPALIEAVIANESSFDPNVTSSAGARGLMQLMPDTAASLGVRDAYDPAENVWGGTRYLRGLLDRFGDMKLAVAAYNAGPAAVERYGGVPPYAQTQTYVRNVLSYYRDRCSQLGNVAMSSGS
jgi:soluble lytic murein transglycosylase-like protein